MTMTFELPKPKEIAKLPYCEAIAYFFSDQKPVRALKKALDEHKKTYGLREDHLFTFEVKVTSRLLSPITIKDAFLVYNIIDKAIGSQGLERCEVNQLAHLRITIELKGFKYARAFYNYVKTSREIFMSLN